MKRNRPLLTGPLLIGGALLAFGLVGVGGVIAGGLQNSPPQNATPAPGSDPIADALREAAPPVEGAPAGVPAPTTPIAITPPATVEMIEKAEDAEPIVAEKAEPEKKIEEPDVPLPRQRRRVAIVEAIDKITAERMRFEVVVGGRPVRFNNSLIFSARACEVSADNELVADAIAYMDISLQARGTVAATEPRQIFRGWMFASTPGVSGLQHPIYDAWVVGCKA